MLLLQQFIGVVFFLLHAIVATFIVFQLARSNVLQVTFLQLFATMPKAMKAMKKAKKAAAPAAPKAMKAMK